MVRVPCPDALSSYLLKIGFKRWAKLWSAANLRLYPVRAADRAEKRDLRVAEYIQLLPVQALRNVVAQKRYSLKKRKAMRGALRETKPNCLLVECYNPNSPPISLTLSVRRDQVPCAFQALFAVAPGFNRWRIAVEEIEAVVDLTKPFSIDLTPNEISDGLVLYFGALDFVVDTSFRREGARNGSGKSGSRQNICKCVVWDLDNTLWQGTLVEDGPESISLKPGAEKVLKGLDERGILMSVASKNNYDGAMDMLRRLGVDEYFLVPQISWNPKSQGVKQIAKSLNIGMDSLLVIDDSPFEREEIQAACPEAMVLDASDYNHLLDLPCCQATVTAESRSRRRLYRDQKLREDAQKDFHGEYATFLRGCGLELTMRTMTEANLERVHELTQRTNQMNFSGNRYTRGQLLDLLRDTAVDTYVLDCKDRFGSYGAVGFCVVKRSEAHMADLMFSCRIQSKRVEHAFVSYLIRKYRGASTGDFSVDYRKTTRNAGPGKVFEDLGFIVAGEVDGVTRLIFPRVNAALDEGIVTIEDLTVDAISR
jgi:FkbH-like protein